jgi:hypothetical protein
MKYAPHLRNGMAFVMAFLAISHILPCDGPDKILGAACAFFAGWLFTEPNMARGRPRTKLEKDR